jgi:hypothetical protein
MAKIKADEKICPRCAEAIKKSAVVCKHCGYEYTEADFAAVKAAVKARKNRRRKIWLAVLAVFVGFAYLGSKSSPPANTNTSSSSTATAAANSVPGNNCAQGKPISGRIYVTGSNVNFRTGPGSNSDRLPNTLSPEIVLEGNCATDEWIYAHIVEVDGGPVDGESGWVAKQFVSMAPSADYTAGLIWDIQGDTYTDLTVDEKTMMRTAALAALKDDPKCQKIVSGDRGVDIDTGKYYLMCKPPGGDSFNIFFTRKDVEAGRPIRVPDPVSTEIAQRGCEDAIRKRVNRPSTLVIHSLIGFATTVYPNGARAVIQDFSAENGFGVKTDFRARCLIQPEGDLEISISESGS